MTEYSDRIKILITNTNQHIVAYLYPESSNSDFYTVQDPMMVNYRPIFEQNLPGKFEAAFMRFCPLSADNVFGIRKDWIVSITDPDKGVLESYENTLNSPTLDAQYYDSNSDSPE